MKKIKWILLGIPGFILFIIFLPLILLVVFAPLRYTVVARVGNGLTVRAKVSYLFRFISVRYLLKNGDSISQMRIAGIRVGGRRRKKTRHGKIIINKKNDVKQKAEKPPADDIPDETEESDDLPPENNFRKTRSILTYPELKIIIQQIGRCLKKFLRTLLPKRLDISGTVGFGDPAATGMFLGLYESIAAMFNLRERVRLAADFVEPGVKLRIAASSSISMARLIRPVINLLTQKTVRQFIRFLKKG